jgi:hypothetical protein
VPLHSQRDVFAVSDCIAFMQTVNAGEAGVPFFYRAGSEFEELYVGVGSRRMRALFQVGSGYWGSRVLVERFRVEGFFMVQGFQGWQQRVRWCRPGRGRRRRGGAACMRCSGWGGARGCVGCGAGPRGAWDWAPRRAPLRLYLSLS